MMTKSAIHQERIFSGILLFIGGKPVGEGKKVYHLVRLVFIRHIVILSLG